MKKSFILLMLSLGLFLFGNTASADTLVASSSGGGSCQNPTWPIIYTANYPDNVHVDVYGLQCAQTGGNVYVTKVFVNGSCSSSNSSGTGYAGTTFSGNACGTWSLTAASTCPYSGREIYSSIPMSEMNTKMTDTQNQCKSLSFACNAAATPIAFSGNTPTYFRSYCN